MILTRWVFITLALYIQQSPPLAFARTAHPGHAAHVHGEARINIVVEGTRATVEFIAPGASLYGFEHAARTDAEKKAQAVAFSQIEQQIGSMVAFPADRLCQFIKQKIGLVADDKRAHTQQPAGHKEHHDPRSHTEVQADFTVACQKPLAGSQVRFHVTKVFPELRELTIQVLTETKQLGATITNDNGSVEL
ncbi:MAG: DUF2796 domain-containing protein [Deltaproteobacteria bacterium]|nr:DUF2796 domain-containing protein [Deltaproteobacteria bacterium]